MGARKLLDILRALPESARLYHSFGTTSVFEGHGAASELLHVYKQTHRAGALSHCAKCCGLAGP